jgi:hypothetical protein
MHSQCALSERSPQAGKRENWQFVDLSRLQFTSDESEFIPDYILAEYFAIWIIQLNLNGYCLNCSESQSSGPGRPNLYGHQYYQD